jgi:hypothetical protein
MPENTNQPPAGESPYVCFMTSEDTGGALRYDFDPDPEEVLWDLSAQVETRTTRGGQISYMTGRTIGPLTVVGALRSRKDLLELGEFVQEHFSEVIKTGAPLRFVYPHRDIDFSIYISGLPQVGLRTHTEGEMAMYAFSAAIVQDHSALTTVKLSDLVMPLPEDVGWIDVEEAARIAEEKNPGIVPGEGEEEDKPKEDEQEDRNGNQPPQGSPAVDSPWRPSSSGPNVFVPTQRPNSRRGVMRTSGGTILTRKR